MYFAQGVDLFVVLFNLNYSYIPHYLNLDIEVSLIRRGEKERDVFSGWRSGHIQET